MSGLIGRSLLLTRDEETSLVEGRLNLGIPELHGLAVEARVAAFLVLLPKLRHGAEHELTLLASHTVDDYVVVVSGRTSIGRVH